MASPEQLQKARNKLHQWLSVDRRIVSYREVAREIKCDIGSAKNILKNHLAENPGVFATYLISGDLVDETPSSNGPARNGHGEGDADGDIDMDSSVPGTQTDTHSDDGADSVGDKDRMTQPEITGLRMLKPVVDERVRRRGMFLVGADQVEERKKMFVPETVGMHVYSLSPARVSDPNNYLACTVRLRTFSNYYDAQTFGGLTGDFELATTGSGKRGESSKSKLGPAPAVVKTEPKPAAVKTATKTGTLNFGAKPKVEAKAAATPAAPTPAATSSKGKAQVEKSEPAGQPVSGKRPGKRVVHSEDEGEDEKMEEPEEEEEKEEPVPPKKSQAKPAAKQPPPLTTSQEDRLAMQAMLDMSDDPLKTSEPPSSDRAGPADDEEKTPAKVVPKKRQSTAAQEEGASGAAQTSGRIRKKRRVKKQVSSVDAKGYMVFEDVSTDESHESDGDSTPQPAKVAKKGGRQSAGGGNAEPAKAKPPSAAKNAPPKKKGQQSLMSFMKK